MIQKQHNGQQWILCKTFIHLLIFKILSMCTNIRHKKIKWKKIVMHFHFALQQYYFFYATTIKG